jgi:peptide/nickel transport system ATP-binding protein
VALVGESGSGKSTLGRVIVGLKAPAAGTLTYDGQPLAPTKLAAGRWTDPPHPDHLPVRRYRAEPAPDRAPHPGPAADLYHGLRGAAREARLIELLRLVELDADPRRPHCPASCRAGKSSASPSPAPWPPNPELIICDEITSALDKVVQAEVLRMLMGCRPGWACRYLFITHDIEVVRAIADRVVVMQHGRIVEQGEKARVFAPPHEPYTETLLASVPEMAGWTGWLDRNSIIVGAGSAGCVLAARLTEDGRVVLDQLDGLAARPSGRL